MHMHRFSAPSRASVRPGAGPSPAWSHRQCLETAAWPRGCRKGRGLPQQHTCHQQQPPGSQQPPSFVDPYQWMQDDPQKLLALLKEENAATARVLATSRQLIQTLLQQLNAWHLAQALAGPLPSPSAPAPSPVVAPAPVPPSSAPQPRHQAAGLSHGTPHPSLSQHNRHHHHHQQDEDAGPVGERAAQQHTWPDLLPTAGAHPPPHTTTTYRPTTSLQGCHAGGRAFTSSSSSRGAVPGPWWVHGVWDRSPGGGQAQQQQQQQPDVQPWEELQPPRQCADGTPGQQVWRLLLDEATLAVGQPLASSREDLIHSLEVSPDGSYLAVTHQGRVLPAPDAPPIQLLPYSPPAATATAAATAAAAAAAAQPAAAGEAGGEADGAAGSASGGSGCKLLVLEVSSRRVVAQLGGCAGPILWTPTLPLAAAGAPATAATTAGAGAAGSGQLDRQLALEQQQLASKHACQQQHLLILSAAREGVWCLTLTSSPAATPQSPLVTPAAAAAAAVDAAFASPEDPNRLFQDGVLRLVHRDPYGVYCSVLRTGQTALVVDHAPDGQPVAVRCWRPDWQPNSSGSGSGRDVSSSPANLHAWQPLFPADESARLGVSLWGDWVLLRRHSPSHPGGQLMVAHLGQHPFTWAPLDLPAALAALPAGAAPGCTAAAAWDVCMQAPPSVAPLAADVALGTGGAPAVASARLAPGVNSSPEAGTAAAAAAAAARAEAPPWLVAVLLPPEHSACSHPLPVAGSNGVAASAGTMPPPPPPYLVLLCRLHASDPPTLLHTGMEQAEEGQLCVHTGSSSGTGTGTGTGSRQGGTCLAAGPAAAHEVCHPQGPLMARVYTTCHQGSIAGQDTAPNPWRLQLLVQQPVQLLVPSAHLHGVTWCEATGELQVTYSSLTVPLTRLTVPLLELPAAGRENRALRPAVAADGVCSGGSREERVALVPAEWEGLLPHLHQEVVTAVSPDGTLVPITIAYHQPQEGTKDAAVASNNSSSRPVPRAPRPCLLHSYGFYGLTEDLSFDPVNLQLLQAGWVVGVAHLRGGGWGGRGWAAAGAGVHKGHALEDLQAAAAYLLQSGIAAHGQLCLTSSSAGAALVLSTLLQPHPVLMRGAVAAALLLVPACDHLGPLLRNGEGAFELGDPAIDPQVAEAVARWDPYQMLLRLQAGQPQDPPMGMKPAAADTAPPEQAAADKVTWLLPDVMLCAGLYDTKAPPSDAAKVAALLRATAATRWALEEEQRWAGEAAVPHGAQHNVQVGARQQQSPGMQQQGQKQRVVVRVVPGGHASCSGVPQESAIQAAFLLEAVGRRRQHLGGEAGAAGEPGHAATLC